MAGRRHRLQQVRKAAGFTQETLAFALGVSPQTVRNWEVGRFDPHPEHFAALALQLNVTSDYLAELLYGSPYTEASAPNPGIVASATLVRVPGAERYSGGLLMSAADESSEILQWIERQDAGALTIEQLHDDLRKISAEYLKVSTVPLFLRVKAIRDRALELLSSGHRSPSASRDLYSAAGWSLALLGWMTVDLGDPEFAEKHLRAAWACAERADEKSLRAWVRATQHTACFWQEEYERAAEYAEKGLQYAESDSAKLFLSSAHALDLARGGRIESSRLALRIAVEAADDGAADFEGTSGMLGPFQCSLGRAGGFWSDAYLAQNEAETSLGYSARALAEFQRTAKDSRNRGSERMVRCQVVKSHLLLGNFDLALDEMEQIWLTSSQHRVGPLVQRVGEIAKLSRSIEDSSPELADIRSLSADFRPDSALKQLSN
ncbi:helix-turn-helix transcriptional regulator [Amycolatopsis sp. NPDC003861]